MERPIPEKIAERYQIKGIIGSGGMGVVLLGYDPNLGIDVAIKMLQKEASDKEVARLQREAMLAGRLNHIHIGKVYDFGTAEDESPYMVMEYFKGQTLSDLIRYKNRLSFEEARPIFIQLCEALLHAHHQGIVHRDLKPSNVFLARQGQGIHGPANVKLLDFGVAKVEASSGEITAAGSIVGSPAYMSPELAEGIDADHRSDIYSLGCLMFETLVGTPPFEGKTVLETVQMHRNNAPPLVSEALGANCDLPKAVDDIIDKCLQKSPANRPQQVTEILLVLEPPEQVAKIGEVQEVAKYIKSRDSIFDKLGINPTITALVAIVVIALVGLASFVFVKDAQKKANRKTDELREKAITKNDGENTAHVINHGAGYLNDEIYIHPIIKLKYCKLRELAGDEDFKTIAPLDFQALDIWDSEITGVGLNYVKDKKGLVWLKMKLKPESGDLLHYACNIKSLNYLEMRASRPLTAEDFAQVARLKNLKRFCPGPKLMEWVGLNRLTDMPFMMGLAIQAENLHDGRDNVYGHGKVHFGKLPGLVEFSALLEGVTDEDLSGIAELSHLAAFGAISNKLTDKTIEFLYPSAGTLNRLVLVSRKSSSNLGEKLSVFPILQFIKIGNGKPMSLKSAKVIASRVLLELDLEESPVTDQVLAILSKNKTVYRLSLGKTQLSDAGYANLAAFPNLINLSIEGETLTDGKVKNLTKSKTIKELHLGESNLTNSQIIMLANMPNLESIKINKCPNISEAGEHLMKQKFKELWHKEPPKLDVDSNLLIEEFKN
ncbi:MAG: serine/threonine protein kinase [Cyanobacteria bacterium TGS_CYA1]|nr:serine/threonine protein kinase [Cyanobacteria bacterium TGS_CYA1]